MSFRSIHSTKSFLNGFPLPYGAGIDGTELVKVAGNKAVIGYLESDSDCQNPMEYDYQGKLYTDGRDSVITDSPSAALAALGLTDFGGRHYDMTRDLNQDGISEWVTAKVKSLIAADHNLKVWYVQLRLTLDKEPLSVIVDELEYRAYGVEWSEEDREMLAMFPTYESMANDAWDELQAQGEVGDFLAIPVRYYGSCHGPGTTKIEVCSIDDCNAAWVPDEDCIDGIRAQCWPVGVKIEWRGACGSLAEPLHAVVALNGEVVFDTPKWSDAQKFVSDNFPAPDYKDLYRAAEAYCQSIIEEYEKWANGDCYGVVVVSYTNVGTEDDPTWEQDGDEEACWGFIGHEYAESELKSVFDTTAAKMEEETAACQ